MRKQFRDPALDVIDVVQRVMQSVFQQPSDIASGISDGEATGPRDASGVAGQLRESDRLRVECLENLIGIRVAIHQRGGGDQIVAVDAG